MITPAWDPFSAGLATEEQAPGAPAPQPVPVFDPFAAGAAAPIDPLDDFDVFKAVEDEKEARGYDPADPGISGHIWNGVKSIVSGLGRAAKGAYQAADKWEQGDRSQAVALASQTAGEVLANSKQLGEGAKRLTQSAVTPIVAALEEPVTRSAIKDVSRRASWEYLREARDTDRFTGDFNQHLETLFPRALQGLGAVPVERAAAQGLSMVLDPANFVPAAAAAKWTMQAPLRGAVRAAQSALKEASLDVAKATAARETLSTLVQPGLAAADSQALRSQIVTANKALADAAARRQQALQALQTTAEQQRAMVDQLATQASAQPLAQRAAAGGARVAGRAASLAGAGLQKVAALPEAIAGRVAGGADDAARQGIADGVRNIAGGFGLVPAAAGGGGLLLRSAGANLETFGKLLAEAESQLPFFKKLSRETTGLSSWAASLVDQSGLGQIIVPAAKAVGDATRGLPAAAGFSYVGSGGDPSAAAQGVGGGLVFGLAGGAYGQWQRYANGGLFRQRQLADINRYRGTLPTDEARSHFDKMPGADRAALATMQLAHPDLKIKHEKLGAGRPSFYYAAEDGPVAVINLDTQDGVNAVVAHEVGHHVERHGLGPVVERVLFGDPLLEQPGLFTQVDKAGKPVLSLDGRYERNAIWGRLKEAYNGRLKATTERTGEVLGMRDDAALAKEIFAEHVADYLLGQDNALTKDLQANVWTRALQGIGGSGLVNGTPALRQMLGKLGVPLEANGKRVSGSELFPGGLPASKYLRRLIRDYHQKSASGRAPAIDDEKGGITYTSAEVIQHPQIIETLFDGSDDLVRDRLGKALRNKDGSPRFATPQEQKAQRAALAGEINAWLEQNPPAKDAAGVDVGRPAAARPEKLVDEKTGKVKEEGWLTPALPEPLLAKLEASGKFNPVQIAHLRAASKLISEAQGGSALFFYQPALKGGKYKGLAGDWRTETPYAIFVSKAGNVLLRTMSREKLMANAQALVQSGKAPLWNSLPELVRDVDKYLANHAAGKPGAEGLSIDKRDQINALFGINSKTNAAANPLTESSPRAPVVIRSRRLDRMNRMTPVDEKMPVNYDRLNRNLRPEQLPAAWDQVKPGMNFDQVKKLIPKAPDAVPPFAVKGPPEVVAGRIKGWLEMNPTAVDADGKKILLASPEKWGNSKDLLLNRAVHLVTEKQQGIGHGGPRDIFRADRARLIPAIPKTLADYHAKLERRGVTHYFRRYADGTLHMVLVDPQQRMVNHEIVQGSLITQYQPESTLRFEGADLVKVRQAGSELPPQ
jgi:hypothetical protein